MCTSALCFSVFYAFFSADTVAEVANASDSDDDDVRSGDFDLSSDSDEDQENVSADTNASIPSATTVASKYLPKAASTAVKVRLVEQESYSLFLTWFLLVSGKQHKRG